MPVKRLRKHHGEMWFIRLTCWKKYDACPALCQTGTEQGEQTERNIRFIDKASKYRIKRLAFVYGYLSKISDSLKEQSNEIFDLQFLSILWTTLVIALSIWKNRMNSTFSSKSTEAKQLARQEKEYILTPKQRRRPLPLLLSPSFVYGLEAGWHMKSAIAQSFIFSWISVTAWRAFGNARLREQQKRT